MQATNGLKLFTVYVTDHGIELRSGCEDYPHYRALHTSKSYDCAYQFAKATASNRNLPLKNWLQSQDYPVLEDLTA